MDSKKALSSMQHPGLAVRLRAARVLGQVLKGAAFVPLTETDLADPRDRALANCLVTVALRRHGHLNHIVETLLSRGIPARSGLFEAALRLGLSQLLFMPGQADHSALHLSVEVVRTDKRAARFDRLLNGVLRQAQREAEKWQALEMALLFPDWLQKDWKTQYGADNLNRFGEALLAGAPLDLTLKEDDPALIEALGATKLFADSVRITERDRSVARLPGYAAGRWWVQDAAAALPARQLLLPAGARVLDMCAAPGGKTAQLIKAGYEVTALDNDKSRLERLEENLTRLNYATELVQGDAVTFRAREKFEGILLDAPCSATGTFRRHPEVLWHRFEEDLVGRVKLQRAMLTNAIDNLAEGGVLVYCTCSLQKQEGEAQGTWVLHNFPHMKSDQLSTNVPDALRGNVGPEGFLRTHPGLLVSGVDNVGDETGRMDGFFVARFRKV
ncbi:MAG TPA: MFS transporter [Devosia sp.]|nr:MFS transporter [Devosia sp.]